jgi:hypothetical protein
VQLFLAFVYLRLALLSKPLLLSVFEKALVRYGSCVLAARHALLTLGQGIASTPLNVFGALAWLEVVTWFSIFSML